MPGALKYFLVGACLILAFALGQRIEAASPPLLTEDQVKAAYIYNFAKFVQWPETSFSGADDPLRICVVGSDSLFQALGSLKNKTVQGRPLEIFTHPAPKPNHKCHLLFISRHSREEYWEKREKRIIPHVLTISDFDSFVSQGGIIEFISEGSKIRFAVNLSAANRAELKLSSKLLKLAVFVQE